MVIFILTLVKSERTGKYTGAGQFEETVQLNKGLPEYGGQFILEMGQSGVGKPYFDIDLGTAHF